MKSFQIKKIFSLFFVTFFFVFASNTAFGGVMIGSVYEMDFDSINFAGSLSTTTIYYIEDTMGEISSGTSSGSVYKISAGFLQIDTTIISLSISDTVVSMSPSLGGLTGGYSNGSTDFNVYTDNPAGYSAYVQAEASPALSSSGDSFSDFTPAGAVPEFDFSVTSAQSAFGFSVEGGDINSNYKDNGSACGVGSSDAVNKCWNGFSTSQKLIAGSIERNDPSGATTTLKFRAGVGSSRVQLNGTYYATTTITVVAN